MPHAACYQLDTLQLLLILLDEPYHSVVEQLENSCTKIVDMFQSILIQYSIKHASVVKILFKFVLDYSPLSNGLDIAASSLEDCLDIRKVKKSESTSLSLRRKSNFPCNYVQPQQPAQHP